MIKNQLILFLLLISVNLSFSQLYINEILTSNTEINYDPDYTGFSDWIEIYNSGASNIDLGGYFLTDNPLESTKWQIPLNTIIPANGYYIFWADGMDTVLNSIHTNFKISKDGETIKLYSPGLILLDSIKYRPQISDLSYGRNLDGDSIWGFFYSPTPCNPNNSEICNIELEYADEPIFSINGGFYSGQQTILLSSPSPTAIIKYTLDGSIPDENSILYSSPIIIDSTTIIRACAFDTLLIPSQVITNTYFIDNVHNLPVISIVTDHKNLWGDTIGIYCVGTNGISLWGINANYWNDGWERPVNIEMYENNGTLAFNQISGIAINGARRRMEQKSLRLFARNKYGKNTFEHKIFKDKEIDQFSSLVLRNGGLPDLSSTIFRDGLCQSIIANKMDIDYQSYRPCAVYLNGKYWGIYNIREKQNEDYLASNHNIDPNNVNILENSGANIVEGSDTNYTILNNFIENNDINNSTNYEFVKNEVDIDEYINYQIAEIYLGNYDWPMINIKYWKTNSEKSKWRWLLFDMDAGLGMWGDTSYNSIEHATATSTSVWPNPPQSTLFFRNLLLSTEFKNEFIQRFAAHSNITFSPQRIIHFIDSLKFNIETEMSNHIARWKDFDSDDGVCVQSIAEWENEVEVIRNYANNRRNLIFQHMINKFNLSGTIEFTTNATNGHIEINTVSIPDGTQTGTYFKNVPVKLRAVPDLGYQFVEWTGCFSGTSSSISISLSDNDSITALFSPTNQSIIPPLIDNDTTLLLSESPYIALGDIVVDPNKTLTIEPGVEIFMPDSACFIVYGELIINGTNSHRVTIDANFDINASKWGAICFYNATDTGKINNLIINNASIGRNYVLQTGAISSYNSNVIIDNTIIDNVIQPFYSEYGNISIKNSQFRSERTCDLINIKYANSAIVENCNLRGNEAPDTDAIDYDQINNGIIRNNKIYGFFGFNSDGIDIGEAASNILIENNIIFNCSDKGISIGQASSANIYRNIIYNCNNGIGIKDSLSYANVDQNTFFNNNYAVACFEKNYNDGGGIANIKNSIFSKSVFCPLFSDELSSITCSYSLSDTEPISGTGNINENPLFTDTLIMNFELQVNSPCINAGDPTSPVDPDLSIADMGAYYTYPDNSDTLIVINEINYHSNLGSDSDDWIELYNNSDENKDMSGWVLMDSKNDNIYNFPEGFKLYARELVVVCSDILKFNNIHTSITNFRGNLGFRLNNDGEFIRLFDSEMNFVDIVEYNDVNPWPTEPNGFGATLELIDPDFNNMLASSWKPSENFGGSPGLTNTTDIIEEYILSNKFLIYPNPALDFINIEIENSDSELYFVNIHIYNIYGQLILEEKHEGVQNHFFQKINISDLSKGVYIVMTSTKLSQNKIKIVKG